MKRKPLFPAFHLLSVLPNALRETLRSHLRSLVSCRVANEEMVLNMVDVAVHYLATLDEEE